FDDAPKALLTKIEQVVRLIRSKGVGVYFVTQNPLDIPESVLGQLGNRVQHALRAFTPRDQKAVRAAAETLRPNPKLDTAQVITELGVGEALVSFLDEKGRPTIVERAFVVPPASRLGPLEAAERKAVIEASTVFGHYEKMVDRESAYEKLTARVADTPQQSGTPLPAPGAEPASGGGAGGAIRDALFGRTGPRGGRQSQGIVESMAKSAARAIGSGIGRQILRGVLGSILGAAKKR
ncbi:MAG: DUF853 family protein, partial [Proteobacteria bacterium]|nr:DUF853 family protein [Pseudomonadota bacterium]